ncbi:zinc finger protein 684-like [Rhineura floridana]|uniref:zinc finger protein 684-like n=1 Tax=Rhineura floridana TaxID=261503 RepID=UPI002AC8623B|nr:zinc finger protein 684-like [Rhineura floridana]
MRRVKGRQRRQGSENEAFGGHEAQAGCPADFCFSSPALSGRSFRFLCLLQPPSKEGRPRARPGRRCYLQPRSAARRGAMAAGGSEAPVRFEDVILYFSKKEWKTLEKWQKDLYWEVLRDNYEALLIVGQPVTKADVLAWLEQCERLDFKRTQESRDPAEFFCATHDPFSKISWKEYTEKVGLLEMVRGTAKEDTAQSGNTGETAKHLPISVTPQGNPMKDEPLPHTEYEKKEPHKDEKPYKCYQCGLLFRLEVNLEVHYRYCHKERLLKCKLNSTPEIDAKEKLEQSTLGSSHDGSRSSHSPLQTSSAQHACSECGKCFTFKFSLHKHKRKHRAGKHRGMAKHGGSVGSVGSFGGPTMARVTKKLHKCQDCGKRFVYKWQLTTHLKSHAEGKRYLCHHCGENFACKSSLLKHCQMHAGERTHENGTLHQKDAALAPNQRMHREKQLYPCGQCGKRFSKRYLLDHQAFHEGRRYRCFLCGKISNFRSVAISHCSSHFERGGSSTRAACEEKGKSKLLSWMIDTIYIAPGTQQRNQDRTCQLSTDVQPKCLDAKHGKRTPSTNHLPFKQHVHSGEQQRVAQAEHEKDHSQKPKLKACRNSLPKPFRCRECGKDYARWGSLMTHRRRHMGDLPFQCAECGRGFVHRNHLNIHWKTHAKESGASSGAGMANTVPSRGCWTTPSTIIPDLMGVQ